MSSVRQSAPGATRSCPHCRAVILESSSVCPACKKYLRFDPSAAARKAAPAQPSFSPLKIEGSIRHPESSGEPWEYSVVVLIKNERGEEVARQVVGVGALQPSEGRTFSFAVEVFTPKGSAAPPVK